MKGFRVVIVLLFGLFILPVSVKAADFGFYLEGAGGAGHAKWDDSSGRFDVDSSNFGAGVAFETVPRTNGIFSYRLQAGFDRWDTKDDYDVTLKLKGIVAENFFMFSPVRRPNVRWWVGPVVQIGFYSGETDETSDGTNSFKTEADMLQLAVGAATGLRFDMKQVRICPTLGFKYSAAAGNGRTTTYYSGGGSSQYKDDLTITATSLFASVAVLF